MGTAVQTGFVNGIRADAMSTFNKAVNTAQGADIASATTTDIGAATGNKVNVTGTTTITGLGTIGAGVIRIVTFTGSLILTHNATSLKLPTSANITTQAGDVVIFGSLGSGNWECLGYLRKDGTALAGGGGGGDVSSNTASSVDNEVVLFNSTTGKSIKRATLTGTPYLTSGVLSANKVTLTQPATGSTLTIADGKTLSVSNTLTFTGTDSSSVAFGAGGTVLYSGGALGTPSSATLTNATGLPVSTGISGLGTSVATALAVNVGTAGSVLVNGGVLGTPSSATLTNATGLPVSTGISGLGAGIATFLATPSSANLAAALTDESGTAGSVIFSGGTPTFTGSPALNTATAVSLGFANGLDSSATLTTSATTADQVLVSISSTTYRALVAEVSVVSSTSYHVFEVVLIHDGTTPSHTVGFDVYTGVSLTSVNSDVNGGNVRLLVTPTNAVTTYKVRYRAINA